MFSELDGNVRQLDENVQTIRRECSDNKTRMFSKLGENVQ